MLQQPPMDLAAVQVCELSCHVLQHKRCKQHLQHLSHNQASLQLLRCHSHTTLYNIIHVCCGDCNKVPEMCHAFLLEPTEPLCCCTDVLWCAAGEPAPLMHQEDCRLNARACHNSRSPAVHRRARATTWNRLMKHGVPSFRYAFLFPCHGRSIHCLSNCNEPACCIVWHQ